MSTEHALEIDFSPQVFIPTQLSGLVDFFGEMKSMEPLSAVIMPEGKVEVAFFLEGDETSHFYMHEDDLSDRLPRKSFCLLFSVSNRPQVVKGKRSHVLLAMMSPAAAMLLFGVPAAELRNRSVNPENLGIDMRPLEDAMKSCLTFQDRAECLQGWMLRRLEKACDVPDFVFFSNTVRNTFHDSRMIPSSTQLIDLTGYSVSQANRLSKKWLGLPLEKYYSLLQFRKTLEFINAGRTLTDVSSKAGYYDQAHFNHRFSQFAGMSPSDYLLTPKTGADTLHV